jgi:hypothetical protein
MTDFPAGAAAPDDLFATTSASSGFAWSPQARPLSNIASWFKGGLYLYIIVQAVTALVLATLLWIFNTLAVEGVIDEPTAAVAGFIGNTARGLLPVSIGVFVVCLILYLMFVFRAAKNLQLSKAQGISVSPGDAVGMSIIPVVNLISVPRVMKEIWVASTDPMKGARAGPARIMAWWGLWIAAGVLSRGSDAMTPADLGEDLSLFFDMYLPGAAIGIIASLLAIASTVILHSIITEIVRAQELLRSTTVFED